MRLVASYLLMFPLSSLCEASLIWNVADGGNGNAYTQVVTLGTKLDWASAKSVAESMNFMGASGHLATITSAEEQLFVESFYDGGISWIGLTDDPLFGGTESFGQPNPRVDGWVWVTREPVTYTNWFALGEPNNQGGSENFVTMGLGVKPGGWNDSVSSPSAGALERYIVEFELSTVPEPASIVAWGIIGLVVGVGASVLRTRRSHTGC